MDLCPGCYRDEPLHDSAKSTSKRPGTPRFVASGRWTRSPYLVFDPVGAGAGFLVVPCTVAVPAGAGFSVPLAMMEYLDADTPEMALD
jgi:hypothetical protein